MLKIKNPTFCSGLFPTTRNTKHFNLHSELFRERIERAVRLAGNQEESAGYEIDKSLKAAVSMKGMDFVKKQLTFLNAVEIIDSETLDLLNRRLNNLNKDTLVKVS